MNFKVVRGIVLNSAQSIFFFENIRIFILKPDVVVRGDYFPLYLYLLWFMKSLYSVFCKMSPPISFKFAQPTENR